jgi:hypothetical protein
MSDEGCEAQVWPSPGYQGYPCSRTATGESLGVRLCAQHRKSAESHRQGAPGHHPWFMPQPRAAERES